MRTSVAMENVAVIFIIVQIWISLQLCVVHGEYF